MRAAMAVLWPAFIMAGCGTALLFLASEFDHEEMSHTVLYTVAFFFLWALATGSSALTCFLQRSAEEVNADARR